MKSLRLLAPAKVNLFLEILRRRPDGYHTLSTVFQEISLADELTVRWDPDGQAGGVSLRCIGAGISSGPDNLVVRAARAFQEMTGCGGAFSIVLKKRIPVGAGLGGGSSDAAATLKACWALTRNKPLTKFPWKSFVPAARSLGADVPFFLRGGLAAAGGVGERLLPLPAPKRFWMVLLFPRVSVATKWVYGHLSFPLTKGRARHKILDTISLGQSPSEWSPFVYNRLEEVVLPRVAEVAKAKQALLRAGCLNALMSGSGSSVFGVVKSEREGKKIIVKLARGEWDSWLVKSLA